MSLWWWASCLLMIGAALLLLLQSQKRQFPPHLVNRRFEMVLHQQGASAEDFGNRLYARKRLQQRLERFSESEFAEMQLLLVQAGWGKPQHRFYYLAAAWILPVAVALFIGLSALIQGKPISDAFMHMAFAFAFWFVGIRHVLRWRARTRQAAIRREVITWLHLLRMLFDAGLSLEHAMRVLVQQARGLIPNLAHELDVTLKRIEAGQDRSDALMDMAAPLAVPELTDTVTMLKQATRYGGNLREPLIEYTKLTEQRQVSELREQVGKLSAKMTVVMVIFLFPALMIFVAGPGFIGLSNALKGVGG
ncbi:MAG TPA: type II secretion system F family protein [Methylophilaceae bacterium]|nr:type II secretion system F family protein [Methylophilaceae bacterium]